MEHPKYAEHLGPSCLVESSSGNIPFSWFVIRGSRLADLLVWLPGCG